MEITLYNYYSPKNNLVRELLEVTLDFAAQYCSDRGLNIEDLWRIEADRDRGRMTDLY